MNHARFYKAHAHHRDDGCHLQWFKKKRDAAIWIKQVMADPNFDEPTGIEPVVIRMKTDEIIRWLNQHFTMDNG